PEPGGVPAAAGRAGDCDLRVELLVVPGRGVHRPGRRAVPALQRLHLRLAGPGAAGGGLRQDRLRPRCGLQRQRAVLGQAALPDRVPLAVFARWGGYISARPLLTMFSKNCCNFTTSSLGPPPWFSG